MPAGQIFIIGVGSIGLPLLRSLSRDVDLVCIDASSNALEAAREVRGDDLPVIAGDATSRLLLEEAGVGEADTVVITTTSEKINLEVARILKEHFQVRRILSVGITQKGIETLEKLGVEVESIFSVSATGLRNRLEQKTKAVQGVGLGKNEILEVEVHPHSRLANKPLAALNPKSWRVGIVYREGNIIVPRGDTVLRPKDRLILLGDPKVLKTVTDLLTFRFTHFPLEYGDTLAAYLGGGEREELFEEIAYLLSVFPLEKAFFLFSKKTERAEARLREIADQHHLKEMEIEETAPLSPLESFRGILQKKGRRISLVVLPRAVTSHSFSWSGEARGKRFLRQLSQLVGCPILLAAGTFPYEKVTVPCIESEGLQHALETTLEMSAAISYQIEALFVSLSRYISSEEEMKEFEEMKKTVADMGLIYKTAIRNVTLRGNPVLAILDAVSGGNLMVTEVGTWRRGGILRSLLQPDVAWNVVRRSPVSTLLIPPMDLIV